MASSGSTTNLPCADDCIAAFELLWTGDESDEIKNSAINDITDQLVLRGNEDISGLAIQQSRYIFVAFKRQCDRKGARLEGLLEETFRFLRPGIDFRVMTGPFARGPKTIDFKGEFWSESPCCQNRLAPGASGQPN